METEQDQDYFTIKRQREDYMRANLDLFGLFMKDKTSVQILKFIIDYQDKNEGLSKEDVARYTDSEGILSRPVTLRIIQKLLENKIILNAPKKTNAQSRLIINPEFDFKLLELNVLTSLIIEIQERFDPLNIETKGTNTILIHDLLATIDKFTKQEEIYTQKQMEKIELDLQKKLVNQTKKRVFGSVRKARNQTGIK